MLARKAADRARKEAEQRLIRQEEERRLQTIPAWKRQLMGKKDEPAAAPAPAAGIRI